MMVVLMKVWKDALDTLKNLPLVRGMGSVHILSTQSTYLSSPRIFHSLLENI